MHLSPRPISTICVRQTARTDRRRPTLKRLSRLRSFGASSLAECDYNPRASLDDGHPAACLKADLLPPALKMAPRRPSTSKSVPSMHSIHLDSSRASFSRTYWVVSVGEIESSWFIRSPLVPKPHGSFILMLKVPPSRSNAAQLAETTMTSRMPTSIRSVRRP
jgi:hypothetical protein